jgi:hypothetical protein
MMPLAISSSALTTGIHLVSQTFVAVLWIGGGQKMRQHDGIDDRAFALR